MGSPGIHLFGIAHVKVGFIPVLKMYALSILEIFDLNYRICTMCVKRFEFYCFFQFRLPPQAPEPMPTYD